MYSLKYVTPFLKRCNKFGSSWLLSVDLIMAIKYASITFRLNLLVGALQIIDLVKIWSKWLWMCFDGFDLSDGVLGSFHLVSTLRIVYPMYVSPQIQTPL